MLVSLLCLLLLTRVRIKLIDKHIPRLAQCARPSLQESSVSLAAGDAPSVAVPHGLSAEDRVPRPVGELQSLKRRVVDVMVQHVVGQLERCHDRRAVRGSLLWRGIPDRQIRVETGLDCPLGTPKSVQLGWV